MAQVLVVTIIKSLPMLNNVLIVALFFYIIFGVLCVQLFYGQLRYRCAGCMCVSDCLCVCPCVCMPASCACECVFACVWMWGARGVSFALMGRNIHFMGKNTVNW